MLIYKHEFLKFLPTNLAAILFTKEEAGLTKFPFDFIRLRRTQTSVAVYADIYSLRENHQYFF